MKSIGKGFTEISRDEMLNTEGGCKSSKKYYGCGWRGNGYYGWNVGGGWGGGWNGWYNPKRKYC